MLRQGGNEQSELPRRDIGCCSNLADQQPAPAAVRSDQRATGRRIGAGAGGCDAFLPRRQYPAYTQHALCARAPRNAFTTNAEAGGLMTVCNSCRYLSDRSGTLRAALDSRDRPAARSAYRHRLRTVHHPCLMASSSTAPAASSLSSDTQKKGGWYSRKWRKARCSIDLNRLRPVKMVGIFDSRQQYVQDSLSIGRK